MPNIFQNTKTTVKSTVMYKGNKRKTIVEVLNPLWDDYYSEWEKLSNLGWKSLIQVTVNISEIVAQELTKGVYILDGDIDPQDYVASNTKYTWVHKRIKHPTEAIGNGNLPGSFGDWVLTDYVSNPSS